MDNHIRIRDELGHKNYIYYISLLHNFLKIKEIKIGYE